MIILSRLHFTNRDDLLMLFDNFLRVVGFSGGVYNISITLPLC